MSSSLTGVVSQSALHALLIKYGYLMVFLFSIIEGEAGLFTAGMISRSGIMNPIKVIAFAILGTTLSEQLTYQVGRRYGEYLTSKLTKLFGETKIATIFGFIKKSSAEFIICSRFIYGIRLISPVLAGAAAVPIFLFSILNIISAIIWSTLTVLCGYYLSGSITEYIGPFSENKTIYIIFASLAVVLFALMSKLVSIIVSRFITRKDDI